MDYVYTFIGGAIIGIIAISSFLFKHWQAVRHKQVEQDTQTLHLRLAKIDLEKRERELAEGRSALQQQDTDFQNRAVSYEELRNENNVVKRDLKNIDIHFQKIQLDRDQQKVFQEDLDHRGRELAARYLKETIKWIGSSLTANNFVACKQRLQDVIQRCRQIRFEITEADEQKYIADLKAEYEMILRVAIEREEQARIKARIREEEQLKREVERELKQLERERQAIQAALDKAMADVKGEHAEEIERLKARLSEAEAKAERTKSQAELTKAGNVYVISNIGSFGQGVFKVGMTRRLEPMDRIRELGDASVPFSFDVHMMIACEDAPKLENALHRSLHKNRINKVNMRKEFFKVDIQTIASIVKEHHGEIKYIADSEALEYQQSMTITDQDAEFIEELTEKLDPKDEADFDN